MIEENNISYIYALADPFTNQIRYIGKSKNPIERYRKHLLPYYLNADTYKNRWIKECLYEGRKPILLNMCEVNETIDNTNDVEKFFIRIIRQMDGSNLTNTTDGGDGGATMCGKKMSKESIDKIRNKQKGKKWDINDPRREQIRKRQLGFFPTIALNKAIEKNTLNWEVTHPNGKIEIVRGLSEFAKKHDLIASKLSAVGRGERPYHKNYKVRKYIQSNRPHIQLSSNMEVL